MRFCHREQNSDCLSSNWTGGSFHLPYVVAEDGTIQWAQVNGNGSGGMPWSPWVPWRWLGAGLKQALIITHGFHTKRALLMAEDLTYYRLGGREWVGIFRWSVIDR